MQQLKPLSIYFQQHSYFLLLLCNRAEYNNAFYAMINLARSWYIMAKVKIPKLIKKK